MMNSAENRLTLDRPAAYQIKVPGHLTKDWSDWAANMIITLGSGEDGQPVTTVICIVDQAALQGMLHHLYSLGLPLISVICLEVGLGTTLSFSKEF
jgi:hypothetical protein